MPLTKDEVEAKLRDAVFVASEEVKDPTTVRGYDFNNGINYDDLFAAMTHMGFQATNLGLAINIVNRMLAWRLSDESAEYIEEVIPLDEVDTVVPEEVKCTIFLSYTSNMVSCGVREVIKYLVQHKMISCMVTTCGAIEEDLMKCMNPHVMGDFRMDGAKLRSKGLNRIGNLLVPNKNYCDLEDFMMPILDAMLEEQKTQGQVWSPSKMINRFGQEINNEDSVYYWAWKNDIPVFCPAITDGSVGDMLYFHNIRHPGLVVDLVQDIVGINSIAMNAPRSGQVILGGGVVKHHTCNANLMRNGADYSVFINTGAEFDGSDSGAAPDEAVSWGKIKAKADSVKVHGDASLIFPLLVSQTFAKHKISEDEKKPQGESKAVESSASDAPAATESSSSATASADASTDTSANDDSVTVAEKSPDAAPDADTA